MTCAKYYTKIIAAYSLILGFIVSLSLFILREEIIKTFTQQEAMILQIMSVLSIFYVYNIVYIGHSFFMGVVRALGTQDSAAYVSVAVLWLLSIPVSCILAFLLEWSTFGLWFGYASGIIILTFILAKMTAKEDWQAIAESVSNLASNKTCKNP